MATMCGGMSTDARWAPTGAVRHVCHDCGAPCVPVYRACALGMLSSRPRGVKDSHQAPFGSEVLFGLVAERLAVQPRGRSHHDAGLPKKNRGVASSSTCFLARVAGLAWMAWSAS